MEINEVLLWPPNPNPESWESDTPNEGLAFCIESEYGLGIVDTFVNYQGHYIVSPDDVSEETGISDFLTLNIAPTDNVEYLTAYVVIIKHCTECYRVSNDKTTWKSVCDKIITELKSIGWQEVEPFEQDGKYFRIKQGI
jgi:hypothetical protein